MFYVRSIYVLCLQVTIIKCSSHYHQQCLAPLAQLLRYIPFGQNVSAFRFIVFSFMSDRSFHLHINSIGLGLLINLFPARNLSVQIKLSFPICSQLVCKSNFQLAAIVFFVLYSVKMQYCCQIIMNPSRPSISSMQLLQQWCMEHHKKIGKTQL